MVRREQGESGDDAYRISAKLVHATIITIIGSLISIGGYMTVWALNDASRNAMLDEKLVNILIRIAELERTTGSGILPIARERLDQIERRTRELERRVYGP